MYIHFTTPWSWVLLKKVVITLRVWKFLMFYGIRRFITTNTRSSHWSLSSVRWIHSTPYYPIYLRSILMLPPHLRFIFKVATFLEFFPSKMLCPFFFSPMFTICSGHSILLDFTILIVSGEETHKLRSCSLSNFCQPTVTFSLLGQTVHLSILLLNTLALYSFLNVKTIFTPLKTKSKIIILYILMCTFTVSERKRLKIPECFAQAFLELILFLTSSWMRLWLVSSTYILSLTLFSLDFLAIFMAWFYSVFW